MEILQGVWEVIVSIFSNSGYAYFFTADGAKNLAMILISFIFLWLGNALTAARWGAEN